MKIKLRKPKYYLKDNGEFVIENYNFSKPFANFFPGIAGKYGIPMWVFYVNRGQGIISFGTQNKSHSILEFIPANKAWQSVSLQGFRTFIKLTNNKKKLIYEPFHNGFINLDFNLNNKMVITSYGLSLEEDNLTLGISIKVEFFNIPNDSYAGLARVVTIKNLSGHAKKMQILDGLPKILPFGTSNLFAKNLSRTIEAWMKVENLNRNAPFYKLSVEPIDRPEVIHIDEGHFYLSFLHENKKAKIIKPIVDPDCIFSPITDFSFPYQFLSQKKFQYPKAQLLSSKTPSAFSLVDINLSSKESKKINSVTGYMRNLKSLNNSINKITTPSYLVKKQEENKDIITELQEDIATKSSSCQFDFYAKQTYLDNILRGGYPTVFKSGESKSVYYLYSRKHGDLERDYNKFSLQPTYFSQGNGNYRDVNQNRRCDVYFNPQIEEDNLIYFLNLIQTDGFNPLVVKGAKFILQKEPEIKAKLKDMIEEPQIIKLLSFLNKAYTPGELLSFMQREAIKPKVSYDQIINLLISSSVKIEQAEHGEGFWTDHWTYNIDLLENYLSIYPENLKEIVFKKRVFTYYDNAEVVKPRSEKYILYNGKPKQLHSVANDARKTEKLLSRMTLPHMARTEFGQGPVYQTTLINKLLCILVNKTASLDPFGVGIEMEANKPNWFDALNGLPALFGSSLCETLELKRLTLFIRSTLESTRIEKIHVTKEIYDFLSDLNRVIQENLISKSPDKNFKCWDKSNLLKEAYRHKTRYGLSGNEIEIKAEELNLFIDGFLKKINIGIKNAYENNKKIYYTYFINEVSGYESINPPFIKPTGFSQKKLPFFLASQMHALRLCDNHRDAKSLYNAVKKSPLFDRKLKMYKVTASLKEMPEEIGRCQVFTPGWLENESIWLHMEYKYLLEILKSGLYNEFYNEFKNILIPFQDPQRYGRSILENSSFIVSSVFPDSSLHGNGYVARLSGSTAEFLNIWLIINIGLKPFFTNDKGELFLRFKPILAGWLFDKKGKYCFNFLGRTLVTYQNPQKKDTFSKTGVRVKSISFEDKLGNPVKIDSDTILPPYSEQIRTRQIKKIDIILE